jgi:putative membrane protein insertion efficiency factor
MSNRAVQAARRGVDLTVGRVMRALLSGLIVGYQRLISPMLAPRCRFYPSCSSYALEAVRVHGAAKGTVLATARVCRCHPWNDGGVDHVPPKGAWKPGALRHSEPTTCARRSRRTTAGSARAP